MKKLTTLLMCFLLVAAAACAKPRKHLKKAKAFNDSAFVADFSAMMDSLKVVGANVVVVKDNKIAYTHSFGLKSRELGEDMTSDAVSASPAFPNRLPPLPLCNSPKKVSWTCEPT